MSRLPAGTDIILLQADGETPGWKLRAGGGGSGNDISLIRFDADGVEQDEPVVIDWATGNVTLSADLDLGDDIVVDSITATTVVSDSVDGHDLSAVFTGTDSIAALGVGGAAPTGASGARLYLQDTNGRIMASSTGTDATTKTARYSCRHYTNAEEPFDGMVFSAIVSGNILDLGGGSASGNAATRIGVWTAANNTTTTGTEQWRFSGANLLCQNGGDLAATGARVGTVWTDDLVVTTSITWDGATTYTPTNVTPDRSYDADATTTAELADVLGTLIADLQTLGILA